MHVLKFGGTSVATASNIQKVIQIGSESRARHRTVIVASALAGITDLLISCGQMAAQGNEQYNEILQQIEQRHLNLVKELIPIARQSSLLSLVKTHCNELEDVCSGVFLLRELSARSQDRIASYGELLASNIISFKFSCEGVDNKWIDSRVIIRTDSTFGYAAVDFARSNERIVQMFSSGSLFVVPGFIGSDADGSTTTLGRGGSDYTAAIIAGALGAERLEIWTDVSGMMTADPRHVANARVIEKISYQEAMELSHFGAKVIYPPTIQPVMSKNIPVWIKNTFSPDDAGTLVQKDPVQNGSSIRGISSINKIALLSLEGSGMVGIPGFSKRLFEALANERINVILITQASSEHSICVGIDESNAVRARQAVNNAFAHEIDLKKVDPLMVETELSIVALVGDNMKSHPGISGKMFGAIGRNGINIRAIAQGSSERNISAVISAADVKKAINVLHEEFFEATYKQVNLFIVGVGNVGSKLLSQIEQQLQYLQSEMNIQLRVIGLANSKKMVVNEEGIRLKDWDKALQSSEPMNLASFIDLIISKNLRNSVFVDVTADQLVASSYEQLLAKSISVVSCNKIACSSNYSYYQKLKTLAREYSVNFLFETNVGAGLPVIITLNDLLRSGDRITRIEAVLSGTLNYVFNHYNGDPSFAEIVRQAQDEGYTEPDPRLDLSGVDVMRKIMILAREAGEQLDMEDIENDSFLPEACMNGDVEEFYKQLAIHEEYFYNLYHTALNKQCKLKFVARYQNGKARVGLEYIDSGNDLYNLYGKDNVVLFYTTRYVEQPLVVKGAGAGADVTASGVFADIIRSASL